MSDQKPVVRVEGLHAPLPAGAPAPDLTTTDVVTAGGAGDDVARLLTQAHAGTRRVVFGDELEVGAVLYVPCHGSACDYPALSCGARLNPRPDHRVTLTRLRRHGASLTGVVVDADGAEWPWRGQTDGPVTVDAVTVPASSDPAMAAAAAVAQVEGWVATADAYRVRVWPSRRWGVVGPWGWRAQVDHLTNWDEHGDVPLFAGRGRWHRSQDEAVDWAVEEARLIHTDDGCGDCHRLGLAPWKLPLVIQVGGILLEDQRPTGGELR